MKAFQQDAYHPLAKYTCFSSHRMSVPGGSHKNKFEQVSSYGHQMSLVESTGAGASWRVHVQCPGSLAISLPSELPCPEGSGPKGGPCIVRSHVQEGRARGSMYGEVQCITGDGHLVLPCEQTDTTENITFQQVCWRVVKRNRIQ